MKQIQARAIYLYLAAILWLLVLGLLLRYTDLKNTGFGVILGFFTLIYFPGVLLDRIIGFEKKSWTKFVFITALGFGFYFLINLLAIFVSMTIYQVLLTIGFLNLALFILAIYQDRQETYTFEAVKAPDIATIILYLAILAFSVYSFLVIDAQSDKLIGDGWFHLAILQKITSGGTLNPHNLWATKTETLNPVYSFPIWHILVGEFAKITGITIFTAFKLAVLPLSIISLLVWFALTRILFKNKLISGVVFLGIIFVFLRDNAYYFLVALASPDSFNRLLLMPVILGLIIDYCFENEEKIRWFELAIITLLVVFMGLIHFIQLIYLVLALFVLLIIGFAYSQNSKFFYRVLTILGGLGIVILPYLVLQNGAITSFLQGNAKSFTGDSVQFKTPLGAGIIYRWSILILPLVGLIAIKNRRFLLVLSVIITSLLIYWPYFGVRWLFLKYFGEIFVTRALANIPHFLIFGLFVAIIVLGFVRFFSFLKKYAWLGSLIFLLILGIILLFRSNWAVFLDKTVLNEKFPLLSQYFIYFFILLLISAVILGFYLKNRQNPELSRFDKLNTSVIAIVMVLVLSLPFFATANKSLNENKKGSIFSNRQSLEASDTMYLGGQKTLKFFQNQSKKVFLTDNVTLAQLILLYSDNFVAEYPYSITNFSQSLVFYNNPSLEQRLATLNNLKVDYIIVRRQEETEFFSSNPDHFKLIFENHYFYEKDRDLFIYEYLK